MKIIIDGNALAHKNKHNLKGLTHEEQQVGIIFGFLNQLYKLAHDYNTHDIAFTWDSAKSLRQKLFPAYKEKRRTLKETKTEEDLAIDQATYHQIDLLYEEVLPTLGAVNNYKISGFEGDDLIASIVYANSNDDFIIATGDEDMYQLLQEGVFIRKSRKVGSKKEYYLYTYEMFRAEYGVTPLEWIDVKALAGCHSDEVPGIKGIGEVTAIKYLKGELTPKSKGYFAIKSQEGKEIYNRNLKLVRLPLHNCPELVLRPQKSFSIDGFIHICQMFDFQYFLRKEILDKWKKVLNLK